ncbi:magnesium and cobalt transport protein CorA [Kineococcus indalonis]|uniref:magnesium and cobalt transport protein CorA n=1 Tax=Kineococcus indalonis TaxID=2696566 RepID=UPI001412470A|nr:magnesium and cobalt transport protein CorA [Kineococcus indalonis]NAZ87325.1 magnesium and cobalt transport protein CorA [Kineococcus indalonis]
MSSRPSLRRPPGPAPAALPVVACKLYLADGRQRRVSDLEAALADARADGGFVWVGLHGTSARDLERLATTFRLPALAVEDAINAHQRPKFEQYPDLTFAVLKPVRYVDHDEVVDIAEVAVFLGAHFLITVRHGQSSVVADVRAELDVPELDRAELAELGLVGADVDLDVPLTGAAHALTPASVLYRLLDHVVDGYGEVVQAIAIDVEEIEEQVFSGGEDEHAERIYKLKREVLEFRRAVLPLVVPLQRLVEGGPTGPRADAVAEEKRPYYRDVLDHLLRAADAVDGYDRLLTDVLQAHLTQVSVRQNRVTARQNEDMRKISAWAAIALVPTAIAGIYGMNFDNMPELHTRYGYFVVLAVILAACVGLYVAFRAKKWL